MDTERRELVARVNALPPELCTLLYRFMVVEDHAIHPRWERDDYSISDNSRRCTLPPLVSDLASIGKVFAKEAPDLFPQEHIHTRRNHRETILDYMSCGPGPPRCHATAVIVEPTPPDKIIETKWDRLRGFEGYPDTKSLYDMFLFSNLKAVDLILIDYGVDESRCGMRDSHLCLRFSVGANEMGWLFGKLREGLVSKVQCFRWVLDATRDESEGETYKELKVKDFSRGTLGK